MKKILLSLLVVVLLSTSVYPFFGLFESRNIIAPNYIFINQNITLNATSNCTCIDNDSIYLKNNTNIQTHNINPASTGTYSLGDGSLHFLNGYINSIFTNTIIASTGSASNPSYSFSSDTNTGIYRTNADSIGFSVGGSNIGFFNNTNFETKKPIKANVGTATNKISILGSTSGDTGNFFYFRGANDGMGGWSGGDVSTDTSVSARYIIRVHLKTSTVDSDGSMYIRDPPPFAPSPDTEAGGTCNFIVDWDNIIIHKHMVGFTGDKVDFYAVQVAINYTDMDKEARERFGLRTTKDITTTDIKGNIITTESELSPYEMANYEEKFLMKFDAETWDNATDKKAMIEKEVNDRIEWRRSKLLGTKVIPLNPRDYGFNADIK